MRSIKSYLDEGFELRVFKESDVKPQPRRNPKAKPVKLKMGSKEVVIDLDASDVAIGPCDYCGKGQLQIDALMALLGSTHKRKLAFVHDHCYVAALCDWGLKEEA